MPKRSAGLLFYRYHKKKLEVLLVHPGGPFWAKKDEGAWTIPKGEIENAEEPLAAAIREVEEETGIKATGNFIQLTAIKLKSGKIINAWAVPGDFDEKKISSNTFEMEWPPGSGSKKEFPEIDRAAWFSVGEAARKLPEAQLLLVRELEQLL